MTNNIKTAAGQRRRLVSLILFQATLLGVSQSPFAQTPTSALFGNRPIRVVVPYSPGGPGDTLGRLVAEKIQRNLGTSVVVENKPGASGNIAAETVVRSAPDGHTLLLAAPALVQNPNLMPKVPYDPLRDLEPLRLVSRGGSILVVPATLPARSLDEFIRLTRNSPGKYEIGSYGQGSSSHIQAAVLSSQIKAELVHVPYKGAAPLVTGLLAGEVQAAFCDFQTTLPHIRSGKLIPIAVTGTQRSPLLPEIPTLAESKLSGFEQEGWLGAFLPIKVPRDKAHVLSAAIAQAISDADVKARILAMGMRPGDLTKEDFVELVRNDSQAWAKLIKSTGIRTE